MRSRKFLAFLTQTIESWEQKVDAAKNDPATDEFQLSCSEASIEDLRSVRWALAYAEGMVESHTIPTLEEARTGRLAGARARPRVKPAHTRVRSAKGRKAA